MHSRFAAREAHLQLKHLTPTILVMCALLAPAQRAGAQQAQPDRFTESTPVDSQQVQQHSIEYSDAYYTRLTIHRIGSYMELPLFGAEYLLGQKLINGGDYASWVKPAHVAVAGTLGGLFVVNTVTGLWNLYDSRKTSEGRARRYLHTALMLGADAGFAYAGLATASDAKHSTDLANKHRNAALVSFGSATAGTLMMWLWNN